MHQWFQVKNQANKTEAYILDEIGGWGITAKDFINEVRASKPTVIDLHINSPGGSVFDGFAIYNYLKNCGAKVNVFIDGIAASIASVIAMAGNTTSIAENAFVMIHNPSAYIGGYAAELEKIAEALRKVEDQIVSIYEAKTKKTREEIKKWMDDVSYFNSKECIDNGLADSITGAIQVTAQFDLTAFGKVPEALAKRQQTQPKTERKSMTKIIALLVTAGLNIPADSTEDQIAEKLKAYLDKTKSDADAAKALLDAAQKQINDAKEAEVKAFVASAVEQKRITADVSASWVKTIMADDGARALLSAIAPPVAAGPLPPEQSTPPKKDEPKVNFIDAKAKAMEVKYPWMKS